MSLCAHKQKKKVQIPIFESNIGVVNSFSSCLHYVDIIMNYHLLRNIQPYKTDIYSKIITFLNLFLHTYVVFSLAARTNTKSFIASATALIILLQAANQTATLTEPDIIGLVSI